MALLPWPSVLRISDQEWNPNAGASRSGGRAFSGREQAVVSMGHVTASLTVPCNTPERVKAMRGLLAGLDGRANEVLVGPCERARAPRSNSALAPGAASFRLAAAALVNATVLSVERVAGGLVEPGMLFGLGDRLHVVSAVLADDGQAGTGHLLSLSVRHWLWSAYPAGTALDFRTPRTRMRLASDDTGALALALNRHGVVTLDLVEA